MHPAPHKLLEYIRTFVTDALPLSARGGEIYYSQEFIEDILFKLVLNLKDFYFRQDYEIMAVSHDTNIPTLTLKYDYLNPGSITMTDSKISIKLIKNKAYKLFRKHPSSGFIIFFRIKNDSVTYTGTF